MGELAIRLEGVNKRFGENHIVKDLDLEVYRGEFLTLLGPSGCGKTTTLRMIAGFEHPDSGMILLNGSNVAGSPPNKRDVNTVFQNYALFPHMTVSQNIGYGMKLKGVSADEIKRRVNEALRMVQMEAFADRKPRQMSGGQQQRVAVARAIVNKPTVLLLDEPLGALDLKLRKQMQFELKALQQKLGITFIYVTHDQEEALTMSDRIAVMNNGQIEQIDSPSVIYNRPATRFVADFIGETNLLHGTLDANLGKELKVSIEGVSFTFEKGEASVTGRDVFISIRPEQVSIKRQRAEDEACLVGRVTEQVFIGSFYKTVVTLPTGMEMVVAQSAAQGEFAHQGDEVYLTWENSKAVVLAG
ncbi:ABC transporter ATP-binding protein [Brevibacillus fluminis]|uniref:Spermidine/putrescine import ATP-binding protein PotA n=1 Tax=Brevibacillus fluminis TaxID=511487 RepID=A0A3M8DH49_9BACL|nr:ABC transporter ATP-binding protein [Brevibacillus fluminis]RNB86919.1 ABC transporter ATP-binding protein [Brevibacillus fluminis]